MTSGLCCVASGCKGSGEYLAMCNIALLLVFTRTSVCIGFVVGPSTITCRQK